MGAAPARPEIGAEAPRGRCAGRLARRAGARRRFFPALTPLGGPFTPSWHQLRTRRARFFEHVIVACTHEEPAWDNVRSQQGTPRDSSRTFHSPTSAHPGRVLGSRTGRTLYGHEGLASRDELAGVGLLVDGAEGIEESVREAVDGGVLSDRLSDQIRDPLQVQWGTPLEDAPQELDGCG